MSEPQLPSPPNDPAILLQEEINKIQQELTGINEKTTAFENILRSKLEDELIEEQELIILYKQQKKAKKEKRLAQKRRGKNYKEPTGIKTVHKTSVPEKSPKEQEQKKRLYREAMLQVHPDKFSMQSDKLDMATQITTKLIEIYRSGDLASLEAYHAHIFNTPNLLGTNITPKAETGSGLAYLQMELKNIKEELDLAKNKYTYKVLMEYDNPMSFLDELKAYYKDRIKKLRKRTRTK
ncbi:hypothetical protein EHW67_10975 [Arenibacter aquaticus]|uniref:Uncharacterized protein n=1 Tax=Arenibacter aquaticus TaxID=2489054 RepID=A0A3S0CKP1_9FLAO|nr:hypothetical protein [Arenibacter aquaticus]RTE53525.1 hypothetical protein EHW67_10975 [Arenibacter aquaticus]